MWRYYPHHCDLLQDVSSLTDVALSLLHCCQLARQACTLNLDENLRRTRRAHGSSRGC